MSTVMSYLDISLSLMNAQQHCIATFCTHLRYLNKTRSLKNSGLAIDFQNFFYMSYYSWHDNIVGNKCHAVKFSDCCSIAFQKMRKTCVQRTLAIIITGLLAFLTNVILCCLMSPLSDFR